MIRPLKEIEYRGNQFIAPPSRMGICTADGLELEKSFLGGAYQRSRKAFEFVRRLEDARLRLTTLNPQNHQSETSRVSRRKKIGKS